MPESFSAEEIARVKSSLDLAALVGAHTDGEMRRSGQGRWVARCPFHEEKSGSFTVYAEDNPPRAHCYGCGWDGDGIAFYQAVKGASFVDAMKELGGRSQEPVAGSQKAEKKAPSKTAKKLPAKPLKAKRARRDAGAVARPDAKPPIPRGHELARIYDYHRPDGSVAHQKIRYQPKTFRQRRPMVPGEREVWEARALKDPKWKTPFEQDGWVYSLEDALLYPYRLPELMAADVRDAVFFCEGEKDADNIASLGLVATTFTDKEFRPEYGPYLAGRWVVVVEDYDKVDGKTGLRAGEMHASRLGREMMKVAARVTWVRMPALWGDTCKEGVDVSDWIATLRETFVADEELRRELLETADAGDPPLEVIYEGFWRRGEREGVILLQDVLASRIVQHRRLLFAGGDFWQWRVRGEALAGTWRRLSMEMRVESWIREVLRSDEATLPLVESRTLASMTRVMKSSNFCDPNELNGHDRYLLNCESGMLNVLSGDLLPHDPRYRSTTQSPVRWDPKAECPLWMEVLERIQPDEDQRLLLQEMFGYCLVPAINYHVFFFLYGDGGTGKSTVADLLVSLVGDENTMALQLEELENAHLRSQLVGKQLYMAAELTAKSFKHIGLIKSIVGGDPVSVDVKYGPIFTFRPTGRFVMTSNVVAHTPDTSGGFERRFLQVDFKTVIPKEERDYELAEKLRKELPGVLRWAVEGFQRLHARGRFEHTKASEEATKTLMRNRASVKEFLTDEAWLKATGVTDQTQWCSTVDLFKHYEDWCDFHGVNAYYETDKTFVKEAYRRREDLLRRRKRRMFGQGEREVGFWGLERLTPPEWTPTREDLL